MNQHTAGAPKWNGFPIDLRPGETIKFEGNIRPEGLVLVPVEFGCGHVKLLVRHADGRVKRRRDKAVHVLRLEPALT